MLKEDQVTNDLIKAKLSWNYKFTLKEGIQKPTIGLMIFMSARKMINFKIYKEGY